MGSARNRNRAEPTPDIYRHEWASFTRRAFPENRYAQTGMPLRIVMKDVTDSQRVVDTVWFKTTTWKFSPLPIWSLLPIRAPSARRRSLLLVERNFHRSVNHLRPETKLGPRFPCAASISQTGSDHGQTKLEVTFVKAEVGVFRLKKRRNPAAAGVPHPGGLRHIEPLGGVVFRCATRTANWPWRLRCPQPDRWSWCPPDRYQFRARLNWDCTHTGSYRFWSLSPYRLSQYKPIRWRLPAFPRPFWSER